MEFFFLIFPVFFLINIAGLIFWVVMLIDLIKRTFKNENEKLVWVIVIVVAGWVGALIYYFMIVKKKTQVDVRKSTR